MSRSNNTKKKPLTREGLTQAEIVEYTEAGLLPFAAVHLSRENFQQSQRFLPEEIASTFADVADALANAGKQLDMTTLEIKHSKTDEEYSIGFFGRIVDL